MGLAVQVVDGKSCNGFICYGCLVGEDHYVTHILNKVAQDIVADAERTVELLSGDKQALWVNLRWSLMQRFEYWCQLI